MVWEKEREGEPDEVAVQALDGTNKAGNGGL